jgi:hypothetical protein
MRNFHKLSLNQYLLLILFIAIDGGWLLFVRFNLHVKRDLLPKLWQRMTVFCTLTVILITLLYVIIKPLKPLKLANTLAIIVIPASIVLSIIVHIIVYNDFSSRSVIMWGIILFMIYLGAFIYPALFNKKALV